LNCEPMPILEKRRQHLGDLETALTKELRMS